MTGDQSHNSTSSHSAETPLATEGQTDASVECGADSGEDTEGYDETEMVDEDDTEISLDQAEANLSYGTVIKMETDAFVKKENDLNVEVATNNKGTVSLFYQGYKYNKGCKRGNKIRWECTRMKKLRCLGRLTTDLDVSIGGQSIWTI